jgi:hypothetical protein
MFTIVAGRCRRGATDFRQTLMTTVISTLARFRGAIITTLFK